MVTRDENGTPIEDFLSNEYGQVAALLGEFARAPRHLDGGLSGEAIGGDEEGAKHARILEFLRITFR